MTGATTGAGPAARPREDIFVSVCLPHIGRDAETGEALGRAAALLSERFAYWEILAAVDATEASEYEGLLARWQNLRLIELRPGLSHGRRRVAVAAEAIGDVVTVAAVRELLQAPLLEMIERADREGGVVLLQRRNQGALNPLLKALGRSAGYRVDLRDLQTTAYSRTALNRLFAIPDRDIALRFPPLDGSVAISCMAAGDLPRQHQILRRQPLASLMRKLGIAQILVVSAAPRALSALALLSLFVGFAALFYFLYAVLVLILRDDVTPGWFTTSTLLAGLTLFLSLGIFGLSAGLRKLLDLALDSRQDDVVGERSTVDLFSRAHGELNVEVEEGAASPVPGAPLAEAEPVRQRLA